MEDHEPDEDRMEARRQHNRLIDELDREIAEQLPPEPKPAQLPNPTPILPGSHHAAAAYKAGCDDEYSNRMAHKYGGDW
jgi:hypothetical protein